MKIIRRFALLSVLCIFSTVCAANSAKVKELSTTWQLTDSSGTRLTVGVSNGNGVVISRGNSNYNLGAIKWENIQWQSGNTYSFKDLSSTGIYTSGTMVFDGSKLTINVPAPSGLAQATITQTWKKEHNVQSNTNLISRVDPPITAISTTPNVLAGAGVNPSISTAAAALQAPTDLTCADIKTATRLNNTAALVDYSVPQNCVLDVTAELVIDAGTVIEFGENAGIGIYDDGKLLLNGAEGQPVVFKGTSSIKGWWRGIHIETQGNAFSHVSIEDAGSNYVYCCSAVASLYLKGQVGLNMQSVDIKNGGDTGIYIPRTAAITMQNSSVTGHDGFPISMHLLNVNQVNRQGNNAFTGNKEDYVYIRKSDLNENATMTNLGVPYLLSGSVNNIKKLLVIEAASVLVFEENGGLGVYDDGALLVQGNRAQRVIMRAYDDLSGYWRGIHIETDSFNNKLHFIDISGAGSNYVYCCNDIASVFLKAGKVSISNANISKGSGYGIKLNAKAEFEAFLATTITSHSKAPLHIPIMAASKIDGENSDFRGNSDDHIRIMNSSVTSLTFMHKSNVPYLIENVIDITAQLIVHEGVDFVFEAIAGLGVYDNGALTSVGTSTQKINMRGLEDTVGFWRGIHIETNTVKNKISHTNISNAGANYVYCCSNIAGLFLKDGKLTISDTSVTKSGGCGIYRKSKVVLTQSGVSYAGNVEGDFCEQ